MGCPRSSVAAVLVAAAAVAVGACGSAETPGAKVASASSAPGWARLVDRAHGLQLVYPRSWRRAERSLTPHLLDPREILSLGTGPLMVAPRRCAQFPVAALEAMAPGDTLVSLQELDASASDYPPRRRPFRLAAGNRSEARDCVEHGGRLATWFVGFRDRGRAFFALVALGRPVTPWRRHVAERVLDSLRFAPVRGRGGA